jgi:hypothetical protein
MLMAQNGLLFGVCLGAAMWPLQSSANKGQSGISAEVTSASLLVEVWLPSKLPVNDGLDAWSSAEMATILRRLQRQNLGLDLASGMCNIWLVSPKWVRLVFCWTTPGRGPLGSYWNNFI